MASYSPFLNLSMRVGTFPRNSLSCKSTLIASTCDFLRAEDDPITAFFFNSQVSFGACTSLRIKSNSAGFSRSDTAAIIKPSGELVSKSLCE